MTAEITPPTSIDELRDALLRLGHIDETSRLTLLHGGVSSLVVIVEQRDDRWVARVPLERLAVEDEWIVDRGRGANEAIILEYLGGRLGPVRVPLLRFFDAGLTIIGEELILGEAPTYKEELMAGRSHPDVAEALGTAASALHELTPPDALSSEGTRKLFDALRLDPYYRATALRVPELRDELRDLIEDTIGASPRTLVHGDLTPKNVLVTSEEAVLLDWEVVSVGDPAFDLGTFTAHLLLKALRDQPTGGVDQLLEAARQYWTAYVGPADRSRGFRHTGAVMLARLYGKSPVEYLEDEPARVRARAVGERALTGRIDEFEALADFVRATVASRSQ